ncbi:ankyrin repeat domain-containing protein, partial [Gemmatimonadota bacterium]
LPVYCIGFLGFFIEEVVYPFDISSYAHSFLKIFLSCLVILFVVGLFVLTIKGIQSRDQYIDRLNKKYFGPKELLLLFESDECKSHTQRFQKINGILMGVSLFIAFLVLPFVVDVGSISLDSFLYSLGQSLICGLFLAFIPLYVFANLTDRSKSRTQNLLPSAVYGRDFVSSVLESAGGAIIIITIVICFLCANFFIDIFSSGELPTLREWINAYKYIPFLRIPDIFIWPWGLVLLTIWFPIIGFPLLWWRSRHSTVKRIWPSNPHRFRKKVFRIIFILTFILVPCTTVLPVILWPRVYLYLGEARLSTGDGIYLSDHGFSVEIHGDPEVPGRRPQDFKDINNLRYRRSLEKLKIINTQINDLEPLVVGRHQPWEHGSLPSHLDSLWLINNPNLSDFSPLYYVPLKYLRLEGKEIVDLSFMLPKKGKKAKPIKAGLDLDVRRWKKLMYGDMHGHGPRMVEITKVGTDEDVRRYWVKVMYEYEDGPRPLEEEITELEIFGYDRHYLIHLELINTGVENLRPLRYKYSLKYLDITGSPVKDPETLEELRGRGVEIVGGENVRDGHTELILAARDGHTNIVEELLKAGADVNEKDIFGETALILAIRNGRTEIVRKLLQASAEVNEKDYLDVAPLSSAIFVGNAEIVQDLLEAGAEVNERGFYNRTALMQAAFLGHIEIVQLLINAGVEVNEKEGTGRTALMDAARQGHIEVVQLLINAGAEVNEKEGAGRTALWDAASPGHIEVVQFLINSGADGNVKDESGLTALMCAAALGQKEIVQALINAGADVNTKDEYGWTALMNAADQDHIETIQILLKAGAEVNEKNNNDETALILAEKAGYKNIYELLKQAEAKD